MLRWYRPNLVIRVPFFFLVFKNRPDWSGIKRKNPFRRSKKDLRT